jgi:hypothetical protein
MVKSTLTQTHPGFLIFLLAAVTISSALALLIYRIFLVREQNA